MSILLEFAMFPTDKGDSVSEYVSRVIKMIDDSGADYQLTPMGTIIETEEMSSALEFIQKAYDILSPESKRIYSTVSFDIREGKSGRLKQKIQSVENKIGKIKT
jgi:uncharacterized protein (TIGR00106 family)